MVPKCRYRGAHETPSELAVTTPDAARATLEAHRHAFEKQGLECHLATHHCSGGSNPASNDPNVIDYQPVKATP